MPLRPIWLAIATACALAIATGSPAADVPGDDDLASVLAQPVYGSARIAGASKYEQDVAETPGLVYVRTGGEIRAQGYRTLADVMESMPGIHLRYDHVYTYVGVRGINRPGDYASRLLLLVDGVRVNDAIYDSATMGREFPVDVDLIDRVEFIPGPGSSLYGSNAVQGVVNVITHTPSQLSGMQATLMLGSASSRKASVTWGGELGSARVLLGASVERLPGTNLYFAEYDSPSTNNGVTVAADGDSNQKVFLKAFWSDITLSALFSDRTKVDPTGGYGVVFNARADARDRYAMANLSYQKALDDRQEVYARIGYEAYRYNGFGYYVYGTPLDPIPSSNSGAAQWLSGELRYVWSGLVDHRVLVGVEFQNNLSQSLYSADQEPAPFIYTDLKGRSSRYSMFVNDEWQVLPTVRLNLGVRSDRQLYGGHTTTPRVAAIWSPVPQWTLKLQRGTAYREPNFFELHYTDGTIASNSALKVESLASTEATVLWRPMPGLDLSATAYRVDLKDLISFVTRSDGARQYQNTARATSRGAEFEATLVTPGGVQLRGSVAVQRATDAETGELLSDAPQTLGKAMVTLPGPWPGSRFGANLVGVGARRSVTGGSVPGYARLNANLSLAPAGQHWSVDLSLYNVLGKQYSDPGGAEHIQESLIQAPRTFRVQLGWGF